MPDCFQFELPAGHLDLGLTVTSGQVFRWSQLPDGRWLGVDGAHWFLVTVPASQQGRAWVSSTGGNRDQVRDALSGAQYPLTEIAEAETFIVESNTTPASFNRLFRLDLDVNDIGHEIIRRGPELEPYVNAMAGLRLMQPSDPVELFFSFVCSANNNLPRITSMVRKLANYGEPIGAVEGESIHRFPAIATLARIDPEELRAKAFGYRAENVVNIARDLMERGGESYLEGLKSCDYETVHRELVSFRGIGKKLADCIALFALHLTESFPLDTHTWQAVTRLYFPQWQGTTLTDRKYDEAAAFFRNRFGELTGWAQQCIFLDNVLNWRTRLKAGT